jgi:predicted peptidase
VFAATEFQRLANVHDFEDNLYTNKDYDNKKQVQPLVIYILNDHNRVGETLNKFAQAVLKASGLEQNAKEFTAKLDKFVNSWKALLAEKNKIPNSFILTIVDHLKNIERNKKESYDSTNPFSLVEEIEEYNSMWN